MAFYSILYTTVLHCISPQQSTCKHVNEFIGRALCRKVLCKLTNFEFRLRAVMSNNATFWFHVIFGCNLLAAIV